MSETLEKYGLGVVAATLMAALAIKCIGWGVAYLPKLPFLPGRVRVKSTSGQAVAYFFQVVTLVLFIAILALALSGIVIPGL